LPANSAVIPPQLPANRIIATLGLIADTHMPERCRNLPPAVFEVLRGVDLLLHAGDVGELWVLDQLSAIAPVVAVHGNDETADAQRELPYQQIVTAGGQRILLTHAHYPNRAEEMASRKPNAWDVIFQRRVSMARRAGAQIVVFGHTHVPMFHQVDDIWLVNPGAIASGNYITRQALRTVALLFLRDDGAPFIRHINLDAPDRPFDLSIDYRQPFTDALTRCSLSILAPDLAACWDQLPSLQETAPEVFRTAILRLAHRCWAGRQTSITRAKLGHELLQAENLPEAAHQALAVLLR
jgi:putative phosphoesterase